MIKRISMAILATATLILANVSPAFAIANTKVNGAIVYTAYGLERYAKFDAKQTSSCVTSWNVTGSYVITFLLTGDPTPYAHDATFSQAGSTVSGSGGYPAGSPYTYTWNVTSGTVTGSTVSLSVTYVLGAPGTLMQMTGVIAPSGSMSGTWTDNFGGTRTGTWSTTTGAATNGYASGCNGNGSFRYADAHGDAYIVNVQYVNVSGSTIWFAGPVTMGTVGTGMWLFVKALDVTNPNGAGSDTISGSFTTAAAAKNGVATMANPADGPFTVSAGNIKVN